MKRKQSGLSLLASLGAALALAACLNDAGKDGPAAGGNPEFVMASNVFGTEGATGYLYTLPSLEKGVEPDYSRALEIPGGAWFIGKKESRTVYLSSGEAPTITKWTVKEDGGFEKGETVSLAGLGVGMGIRFGNAVLLSDTKAYLLDAANLQIAIWNPAAMTAEKAIKLEVENLGDLKPTVETMVARDDLVFVTVAWTDGDWTWGDRARILAIDPATDEVVGTFDEERAQSLNSASTASNGTAYFSPLAFTPVARKALGDGFGTSSSTLRVVPPGQTPEAGFDVDLSALAGGRPAGGFALASDDVAYFQVFYPDENGMTKENFQDKLWEPGYRWWRWQIGSDKAEEIPDQQLALDASHYRVDGKTYSGKPSADWSSTTVFELRPDGEIREGLTVKGAPSGIQRIR